MKTISRKELLATEVGRRIFGNKSFSDNSTIRIIEVALLKECSSKLVFKVSPSTRIEINPGLGN